MFTTGVSRWSPQSTTSRLATIAALRFSFRADDTLAVKPLQAISTMPPATATIGDPSDEAREPLNGAVRPTAPSYVCPGLSLRR